MSKETNTVKQAIKSYLDNRAKTDELFAASYAKPNKSIDECFDYILSEAKKMGNAVYLSDDVVFGWAVHYYDEDDIKVKKLSANTKVSVKTSVDLTEEDKEKAKEEALQQYKQQCIAEMKEAEEKKAKKEAERKKAKQEELRKKEQSMPTLFEFE